MPLCWSEEEQMMLTPAAQTLLRCQREKYERDVQTLHASIPEHLRDWYKYYWLVVNTRCFYWAFFKKARDEARKGRKLPRDECLALVPWGDYFNHEDHGCRVVEDVQGAAIICDRSYSKGEEVVVSYGAHSNDYLLVEYGFILASNRHDCTTIDHLILPLLSEGQRNLLEDHHYLGEYYLSPAGLCYRTQVAIRAMVTSSKRMQSFLAGEYDGEMESKKMDKKTREIWALLRKFIEQNIARSEAAAKSTASSRMTSSRWCQLEVMLDAGESATLGV
ncbi:hypothetical protein, variant [Verruconis gallopava]|nr:hypothetical protein, variant [Verruconis gallopava]KIW02335.1 hypothetical protein, variant [Verruconis gallopava]